MKKVFLLFSFILLTGTFLRAQTVNVTFQADMRVEMAKGNFNPGTDTVFARGSFNDWGTTLMTDDNADSVYTAMVSGVAQNTTIAYKFYHTGNSGTWEDDPNKEVNVGTSDITADARFFNVNTPYSKIPTTVTFNVDMHGPANSTFNPASNKVFVAGSFTDWQNGAVEMTDPDGDTTYSVTVNTINSGQILQYKFVFSATDAPSGTWESPTEGNDIFGSDNNRIYGVVDSGNTITRFWNNADPNVTTANGNIFFEVDMSVATELGVFNPDVDSVQIRGSFNGWSDTQPEKALMNQNPADPNDWFLDVPFTKEILNGEQHYKYFIKNGSSSTPYANTGWEVSIAPTDAANRDRPIIFEGNNTQEAPLAYFDGVKPDWVIPAGTTVECNFSVDMTYATLADSQGTNPVFHPETDTVFWIPQHPFYYAVNGIPWGPPVRVLELTDPDKDMIYTGTLTINGPNFNGFLYTYGYSSSAGIISEAGSQLEMRLRFIDETGPRVFVSPYDMPQDIWSNSAKPEELGPKGLVAVREIPGKLNTYKLEQNYPNPFNPTTNINFSIQKAGLVTLKVYNILGQEVSTLINNEMNAGTYNFNFNASNLSSGVYFYTINTGNYVATKKMILMK